MPLRPTVVVTAAATALVLAGCTAPAPGVTVFSGSSSDRREAVCWSDDGAAVNLKQCLSVGGAGASDKVAQLQDSVGEVPVVADQTIGISVDPEVADRGWYVTLGTNRVNVAPITGTYYRFSLPSDVVEQGNPIPMYVLAVGDADKGASGVWAFQLVPEQG